MRVWILSGLLLLGVLSGCVSEPDDSAADDDPAAGIDHDQIAAAIGAPIVMDHDHNAAAEHQGGYNLEQVSYSDLGMTIGDNGFANFVIWPGDEAEPEVAAEGDEQLALVAIDGDSQGGFAIVDIQDPGNITVLGTYWIDGNSIQEVRITPNGRFAVMNVQALPGAGTPAALTDGDLLGDCNVCIHVVDIQDRTQPELVSVMPVELLGTHNFHFETYDDGLYLFYVGQPLYNPWPDPGNHVYIARFEETATGAQLVPVSDFAYNPMDETPGERDDRFFPHDVLVQDHPDGTKVAYISYWDAGVAMFDVSDPMAPELLAVEDTRDGSGALAIHWTIQEPLARADGRVYASSAPEIGGLESDSGVVRIYNVTDPLAPEQISTWGLPGNVTIEGRYIMSPHTTMPDMQTGLLAVSHYHAGVWILDISDPTDPRHLGYYLPTGPEDAPIDGPFWWKKPNFSPDGYGPNVYQVRWHDGLLWMTDRGTGLYAMEYTGPVPGPLV